MSLYSSSYSSFHGFLSSWMMCSSSWRVGGRVLLLVFLWMISSAASECYRNVVIPVNISTTDRMHSVVHSSIEDYCHRQKRITGSGGGVALTEDMCDTLKETLLGTWFTGDEIQPVMHIPIMAIHDIDRRMHGAALDLPLYLDGRHVSMFDLWEMTGASRQEREVYCATSNVETKYLYIGPIENPHEKALKFCAAHGLRGKFCDEIVTAVSQVIHEGFKTSKEEIVHQAFRPYFIPISIHHQLNAEINFPNNQSFKVSTMPFDNNIRTKAQALCLRYNLKPKECMTVQFRLSEHRFPRCSRTVPSRERQYTSSLMSLSMSLYEWKNNRDLKIKEWIKANGLEEHFYRLIKFQVDQIISDDDDMLRIPARIYDAKAFGCRDSADLKLISEAHELQESGYNRHSFELYDRYLKRKRGVPWNAYENQNWKSFIRNRQAFQRSRLPGLQEFYRNNLHTTHKFRASSDFGASTSPKTRGSLAVTSKIKLLHDEEQIQYLIDHGRIPKDFQDYVHELSVLRKSWNSNETMIMEPDTFSMVGDLHNTLIYLPSGPPPGNIEEAVNPHLDFDAFTKHYFGNGDGVVVIDSFLTKGALNALIEFCNEATIFFEAKPGYLGAYFDEGLSLDLFVQIEDELRFHLPEIMSNHTLSNLWAYKYDGLKGGIRLHADNAAVNFNFWITPDSANLNPDNGGLTVYNTEAPLGETIDEWNDYDDRTVEGMHRFLEERNASAINVPYRQNRAVLFNSNLLHATAPISFKRGYTNRRINLTMLFGKRQKHIRKSFES